MTLTIVDRSPLVIAACVVALALRPIGWTATAVTLAVGALAAVSTVDNVHAQPRLVWPVTVAIGVAAFVFVRTQTALPAMRMTAAGIAASVGAAVAEELFFRRLLYARFERWGALVAVLLTAGLFAVVHAPAYGLAAVPIDLAAGLVFGWQRWASCTWSAPAATHVAANLVQVMP